MSILANSANLWLISNNLFDTDEVDVAKKRSEYNYQKYGKRKFKHLKQSNNISNTVSMPRRWNEGCFSKDGWNFKK